MTVDVWMQHPTQRFRRHEMFASLRRWTGQDVPAEEIPLAHTTARMDEAGIDIGLLSAWWAPREEALISNDEVAAWVATAPDRYRGVAVVDLSRPVEAVRELRRCVQELGFVGLRVVPWLWELPPTHARYYPLYTACVELGVPFCTQSRTTARRPRQGKASLTCALTRNAAG
jgi:predicted TIM-barrel fold metal-dependent hydrolase